MFYQNLYADTDEYQSAEELHAQVEPFAVQRGTSK